MKHLVLVYLAIALVVCASPALAYNEILNGDFSTGDLSFWQHGVDIDVALDGPGHEYAATCKNPGGDLWLRQIVDDSLSPEWNWALHQKVINASAQIAWSGWVGQGQAVTFRFDWWDETMYNNVQDPTTLPYYMGPPPAVSDPAAGYFVSQWYTFDISNVPALEWVTIELPELRLPIQPRWVSLEIELIQPAGVSVWLDNVVLTGKCVPEPSSMLSLFGALGVFGAGLRLRRR